MSTSLASFPETGELVRELFPNKPAFILLIRLEWLIMLPEKSIAYAYACVYSCSVSLLLISWLQAFCTLQIGIVSGVKKLFQFWHFWALVCP